MVKRMDRVQISNTLDLKGKIYELQTVLIHYGMLATAGHYFIYRKINQNWFKINDQDISFIENINFEDIGTPYLLFYTSQCD